MNIAKALKSSESLARISDTAVVDTNILLAHTLEWPISRLRAYPEYALSTQQQKDFVELISKRSQGVPIAYLTNKASFWSLELYVNESCLIPRPETEVLVETVLNLHGGKHRHVLDLGTGSGAISIALATEQPNWQITAVDYSHAALQIAAKNCANYNINNITLLHSNWFSSIQQLTQFDLIVANPPYIAKNDSHLHGIRFEPQTALVADNNGLSDLQHIITTSPNYLANNGYLFLEHGFDQRNAVRTLFEINKCWQQITNIKDLDNNPRVTYGSIANR